MDPTKVLILGGSKGLGKSIAKFFKFPIRVSRQSDLSIDFSTTDAVSKIMRLVEVEKPKVIFYSAGGGPHGDFFSKNMESHMWAYHVNHFTPIALAYELIKIKYDGVFLYVGSAIAERSNSEQSLSYAFSKKMSVKTLLSIPEKTLKIRVFSPPYMNTGLLPPKAWPRVETPKLVVEPDLVAKKMMSWLEAGSERGSAVRHFDWIDEFEYSIPEVKEI